MNQPEMHNMIQNGQFGTSGPMGYNPYANPMNNMIPLDVGQPSYGYHQQNNGYIFQPVGGYINQNPYQQQYGGYQQNPYGFNPYASQQPKYDYYNPYGTNYNNPYQQFSYNNYSGYQPFSSPLAIQQYQNQQTELMKTKFRIANGYFGKSLNEEELDKKINPQNPANRMTAEQARDREEYNFILYLSQLSRQPQPESMAESNARMLREMSYNMHKELDNHSLCEFLENDLWKLQREEWIKNNIQRNANRNLSSVYDSRDYNELLNMHRSSNPYINELLDNSRYDNNIDDMELGMNIAFDKERRRKQILEGKVPSFISSEETQRRRHEFTSQIMQAIYNKGAQQYV